MILWIETQFIDLVLGESIAIDGICLTVTEYQDKQFCCHISPETWNLTTAADFKVGRLVNLERALRLNDRLGGHLVMGHVDQTVMVSARQTIDEFIHLAFTGFKAEALGCLVKKGSIAVNGVSLTINQILANEIEVMLIPHTLAQTNLRQLKINDKVNIEHDWIAKLVQHQFQVYRETIR